MSVAKDLARLIVEGSQSKTTPYDTTGTVKRVEGDTAYVVFDENTTETPVDLSIACEKGDKVVVRVSGNRARLTGNMTAPPTDDKVAKEAKAAAGTLMKAVKATQASVEALTKEVEDSGSEVESVAIEYILSTSNAELIPYDDMEWSEELPEYVPGCYYWTRTATHLQDGEVKYSDPVPDLHAQLTAELQQAVNSEGNYFWYDSSGAYVTKTPKEAYQSSPTGYATRWTGEGILQYYDNSLLTSWTGSGVSFYRTGSNTPLASFGTGGILFDPSLPFTVGNANSYIKWVNDNGTWKIKIAADAIEMGGQDVLVDGDACQWYSGTGVYGTSTSPTIFSGSGVADAKVGDMYLNTTYSRTYRCTVAGAPSTARWAYVNSIKGADGQDGQDGADGIDVTSQYMSFYSSGTNAGLNVYSGYKNNTSYSRTYVNINSSNGMTFYVNGTDVARYGSTARIGNQNGYHVTVESDGMYFYDSNSSTWIFGVATTTMSDVAYPVLASQKDLYINTNIHISSTENSTCNGEFRAEKHIRTGDKLVYQGHAPSEDSETYVATWHKTSNDNYTLCRRPSSSRRYKHDIIPVQDPALDPHHLYDIPVMQYKYKDNTYDVIGLIAEDVHDNYPVAAIYMDDEVENWNERYIIPPMLYLIQEQNKRIEALERRLAS
jgi:hypothetical protein